MLHVIAVPMNPVLQNCPWAPMMVAANVIPTFIQHIKLWIHSNCIRSWKEICIHEIDKEDIQRVDTIDKDKVISNTYISACSWSSMTATV